MAFWCECDDALYSLMSCIMAYCIVRVAMPSASPFMYCILEGACMLYYMVSFLAAVIVGRADRYK